MKFALPLFFVQFFLFACSQHQDSNREIVDEQNELDSTAIVEALKFREDSLRLLRNEYLSKFDLVDVQSVNPSIKIDLKYATADNFMKMVLYTSLDRVYLQRDVAERLSKCQNYLDSIKPDYSLLVYDGVRPVSVQQKMWDAMDSIPIHLRGKFVSNPKNLSLHNFGAAVDVTIIDPEGKLLDMGAEYDDPHEIAYPSMEAHFLAKGELTKQQITNRQLLRSVMRQGRFVNIPSEWWHFNACSRWEAKEKYLILSEEPQIP